DRVTAAFSVADALNPRSILIPVNRIEGLTRAVVAPDPGKSLIAGQGGQGEEAEQAAHHRTSPRSPMSRRPSSKSISGWRAGSLRS
ncbi:MAG TPA: hypothetical protein VFC23_21895, partial [Thermoanaerobaculia bacterium]|nr:hypothetical protein [Thermoanaerobaculia bacterium]